MKQFRIRAFALAAVLGLGGTLIATAPAAARPISHCDSARVCVYKDKNWDGTYSFYLGYASSYGTLNNEVSSVINNRSNTTDFYTGNSYTGIYFSVIPGDVRANLADFGFNDDLQSHRPR